ncbi:oxidoreductase BOA1 [Echria macrotheca]|uniref:Oxidoreductase BOA1 n=1 Tax=Echria macrotheca TaxID=438768 RepID=A0AAJ0FEA9_9PEZI|nr:oxidoreductase BOA1 [Echria macrotheca]
MSKTTVAVAGGTGSLGRTMVDALNAAGYDVVVLARKASPETAARIGVRAVLAADYSDVDGLVKVLEDNGVHTLISTNSTLETADDELNIMKAAERSSVTWRYIPSIWGVKSTPEFEPYLPIMSIKLKIQSALPKIDPSRLQTTAIYNGYFADYYLDATKIPSYFQPWALSLDIPHRRAALPLPPFSSFSTPPTTLEEYKPLERKIAFNHTTDIARIVAALLSLEHWPEEINITNPSSVVSLTELMGMIEGVLGGEKFEVTFDGDEMLQRGEVTELPGHREIYLGGGCCGNGGVGNGGG